jgi:hypothetical protein
MLLKGIIKDCPILFLIMSVALHGKQAQESSVLIDTTASEKNKKQHKHSKYLNLLKLKHNIKLLVYEHYQVKHILLEDSSDPFFLMLLSTTILFFLGAFRLDFVLT